MLAKKDIYQRLCYLETTIDQLDIIVEDLSLRVKELEKRIK